MWIGRSKSTDKDETFPGYPHALDGHAAVYAVETTVSDAVVVQSAPDMAEITGPMRSLAPAGYDPIAGRPPAVRHVDELRPLIAQTAGYAVSGLRTGAMVTGLAGVRDALYAAAGMRLTFVLNLTCRALRRQAGSLHGGHEDYYAAAGSGVFQMFAKNPQEAADFMLIAHRVAELSLTPGVCAQDFYQTSHSVQGLRLPEHALLEEFLGRPGDTIDSPTPAQALLFGPTRRRVPALVNSDHPAGVGGVQDGDAYYKAVVAQNPFFSAHLESILADALGAWGELTGRRYPAVSGYRTDDADYVVIAQGAVVEALEAVVDRLRDISRIKVGVVNLSVYRPFPGAQLTRLLKGKKAVTVLERTDQALAEDLPLVKEVRSAIDKALENANSDNTPIHEGYESWRRPADRPRIIAGVYGVGGGLSSSGDLTAVFENMAGDKKDHKVKTRFYLGADFQRPTRRFPHLQSLQQRLRRDYPDLDKITLSSAVTSPEAPAVVAGRSGARSLTVHSLSFQGGVFAGNLFAQVVSDALERDVRTFPLGGLDPGLQPARFTLSHSDSGRPDGALPEYDDIVLASSEKLLETAASRSSVRKGGTIVVGSNCSPEQLWSGLSRRARRWIQELEARVYVVDAAHLASEAASQPQFADQLILWALLGAGLKLGAGLDPNAEQVDRFSETLRSRLQQLFGAEHYLVEDISAAVKMGFDEPSELQWQSLPADQAHETEEPEAPWTVQRSETGDDSVYDPARFWRSVGFLYDAGEPLEALIDPYVAMGIVPGGSSAYRDMAPYRLGVPRWLSENCTGCGLCWAHCPDSALPATIQSPAEVIKHAMSMCERNGVTMIQMQRVADHLAKQTYRVAAKDDLCQHRTMGGLLRESFTQLAEKMKLDEEKLQPLQSEFDHVVAQLEDWPIARTERFFDAPHVREKGSGRLLSISFNPLSCKGCNLCLAVCPDDAFVWTRQTPEVLETARKNWEWQMSLPAVSGETIDSHVDPEDVATEVNRLLDKHAYHSLVGGDAAPPGQSVKTAVHLVTGTIESVMRRRYSAHVDKLSSLIQQLEDKIQGKVAETVEINDFDNFGRELDQLGKQSLTPEKLAKLAGDERGKREIDPSQLKRLGDTLAALKEQRRNYADNRARMILTIDPGGTSFWSGTYPDNPHAQPWVCNLPGDAPALAEGVFEGVTRALAEELAVCRRAELELADTYDPREHDSYFHRFDWREFTNEERELVPPVVVLGYTGKTAWDDIFRLLARRFPVKILVVNTGAIPIDFTIARETDDAVPTLDRPTESSKNNDPGLLALARRGVYVLQSTVGNPGHLIRGVVRGLSRTYPALFHVHAPDPQTSGIAPDKVAEQATLAYQSRAFPLFEADPDTPGALVTLECNPDPDERWTSREMVFADASNREEKEVVPVTVADWAVGQSRFLQHFTMYTKGHLNDKMKLLPDYLALNPDQRAAFEPIIHVIDDKKRRAIAVPSPAIVRAEEERQRYWKYLRELAGGVGATAAVTTAVERIITPEAETPVAVPEAAPPPGPELDQALHQKLTEKLLWLSGFSQDPDFFKQSLREFLVRKRESGTGAEGTTPNTPAE